MSDWQVDRCYMMYGFYSNAPQRPSQFHQWQQWSNPYSKLPNTSVYDVHPSPPIELNPISPPPYPPPYFPTPAPAFAPPIIAKRRQRRCIDYGATLLLILVWGFLLASCCTLLFLAYYVSSSDSDDGVEVLADEIAGTVAITSIPILIATILNEMLVDRCWRRVVYAALGDPTANLSNAELARNLRAANFEWLNFTKRLFRGRLSRKDFASLVSYMLLRWGTAVSIASVQLSVTWRETGSGNYTAHKRYAWPLVPVIIHAVSVFGTMLIWLMPPWTFFSDRFQDSGLLMRYLPYLNRVRGGSAAKYAAVADVLDPRTKRPKSLTRINRPGIQFGAKVKGIWLGLVCMNVPPVTAWAFFQFAGPTDILTIGLYRSLFNFVFLAQNILYLMALDFVVWNLSLEGFSKRRQGKGRPNKDLRYLGYSSGVVLFIKACKQRRPIRTAVFFWLFWLQACAMRFVTALYTMGVTVSTYGTYADRKEVYDPYFWMAWTLMTALFAYPLFFIWLITKSEAPVCEQDGWRWARLARDAFVGDVIIPGHYGIRNGEAVWGRDVIPFSDAVGKELL